MSDAVGVGTGIATATATATAMATAIATTTAEGNVMDRDLGSDRDMGHVTDIDYPLINKRYLNNKHSN